MSILTQVTTNAPPRTAASSTEIIRNSTVTASSVVFSEMEATVDALLQLTMPPQPSQPKTMLPIHLLKTLYLKNSRINVSSKTKK